MYYNCSTLCTIIVPLYSVQDCNLGQVIVEAIFVNFLQIFKVSNFAHFHVHERGIVESGMSCLLTSFREQQCFVFETNICEHALVCVKIAAECKEYVLLEAAVAIQDI